jgi:hypothetical protein
VISAMNPEETIVYVERGLEAQRNGVYCKAGVTSCLTNRVPFFLLE